MPLNYDLKKNKYLNTLKEQLTHPRLIAIQSKMTLDTPVSTKEYMTYVLYVLNIVVGY